jgi:predicted ABC-type ATPase
VADPSIFVLAGTNGAGKSSVGGSAMRRAGASYFNPDEAARRIREANLDLSLADANAAAWQEGRQKLERSIAQRSNYGFETTLGGHTLTSLLEKAMDAGIEVRIWYAGLATPELHLARVRARVAKGGHDIPEANIRRRYDDSRSNLIRLLARLTELYLYDNSEEADPALGKQPRPRLLLHLVRRRIKKLERANMPDWAKPIAMAALKISARP